MADYRKRDLTTKDDVSLTELLIDGMATVDAFNDAARPFREMLATTVSDRVFTTAAHGDMTWHELAEGEHARTGDVTNEQVAFSIAKYGRSLGFTQEFIEDNPADEVLKRFRVLVEGALKKEHEVIFGTIQNGVADGSALWYDVPDYGAYTFSNTHDHTFADTNELFGDANPRSATAHIREANKQLRHHGKRPSYALISSEFAAEFVDELAWDATFHIPDATSLRSQALPENRIIIDGVTLMQTPWIADTGGSYEFYVVSDEKPVAFHEARPVTLTQGANGGPVGEPGALIGAYGSARYGTFMADPLAAVKVNADNLA
ncbi:hypothetical protein [Halorubellus litoreus]|uniref:Major capsid protein n=1 Tax=Halorubellus litoreus TaxID=755308 RepID=A0ABD5VEH0_9EURY